MKLTNAEMKVLEKLEKNNFVIIEKEDAFNHVLIEQFRQKKEPQNFEIRDYEVYFLESVIKIYDKAYGNKIDLFIGALHELYWKVIQATKDTEYEWKGAEKMSDKIFELALNWHDSDFLLKKGIKEIIESGGST